MSEIISHNWSLSDLPSSAIAQLGCEIGKLDSAASLLASYSYFNGPLDPGAAEVLQKGFKVACEVGHDAWPRSIRGLWPCRDVLDVGCGTTFYGAVIRALGAKSYYGVDPRFDANRRTFRSRLVKGSVKTALSVGDVTKYIPQLAYSSNIVLTPDSFDLAVAHTVTEHLLDLDGMFKGVAQALRKGGQFWFLHDNFYSWAGHHMAPNSPSAYDPSNAEHVAVADWAHVKFDAPPDHPFRTNLNRIRIDELRAIVERYFEIDSWEEVAEKSKVVSRLTRDLEKRLAPITRRELTVKHVVCLATVKKAAAS
jgi:SAM-dependent methyltransferase